MRNERESRRARPGAAAEGMADRRVLSREECESILERAHGFARGGGETRVVVTSWWQGELRWGRNRVSLSSDRRDIVLGIERKVVDGRPSRTLNVTTNQLDDGFIEAAVRAAERKSLLGIDPGWGLGDYPPLPEYPPYVGAPVWSDATFNLTTEARGEVVRAMIAAVEAEGLLSAGYLEVRGASAMSKGTEAPELRQGELAFWDLPYSVWTHAQLSITVRDSTGGGSGWAALASYDWNRIDPEALTERAIQKCVASRNPVALEPGRYTVILEPQAVADLIQPLVHSLASREDAERPSASPWYLGPDEHLGLHRSKLGMKVVDSRISISHDPSDPSLGIVAAPMETPGTVTWIDRGVLTNLGFGLSTDVKWLEGWHTLRGPLAYRMSGGDTTIEEMIASTRRGLLVTRFSNIRKLDDVSLLCTGLTRDGLWLIENGQITKAVKNFRFTESPLFVLNNVEQLGEPVPVFRPVLHPFLGGPMPAMVPALKVRDFSFTSLVDAV